MIDPNSPAGAGISAEEQQFLDAATARLYRWMAAIGVAGAVAVLIWRGPRWGGGFAAGAALSVLNFHWLKGSVDALAGVSARRNTVVARFLLRYALLIAAGYAIFASSVLNIWAFLAGLFVFVAGVLAEIAYELATGTGPEPGNQP